MEFIIPKDGHCLFRAVAHQLNQDEMSVETLRKLTSQYVKENRSQFQPFLLNSFGDILNDEEFSKYCQDLVEKPVWGGQIEIEAMTNIFNIKIEVIQMNGPILFGSEGQVVTLTYKDNHYHSTVPKI